MKSADYEIIKLIGNGSFGSVYNFCFFFPKLLILKRFILEDINKKKKNM